MVQLQRPQHRQQPRRWHLQHRRPPAGVGRSARRPRLPALQTAVIPHTSRALLQQESGGVVPLVVQLQLPQRQLRLPPLLPASQLQQRWGRTTGGRGAIQPCRLLWTHPLWRAANESARVSLAPRLQRRQLLPPQHPHRHLSSQPAPAPPALPARHALGNPPSSPSGLPPRRLLPPSTLGWTARPPPMTTTMARRTPAPRAAWWLPRLAAPAGPTLGTFTHPPPHRDSSAAPQASPRLCQPRLLLLHHQTLRLPPPPSLLAWPTAPLPPPNELPRPPLPRPPLPLPLLLVARERGACCPRGSLLLPPPVPRPMRIPPVRRQLFLVLQPHQMGVQVQLLLPRDSPLLPNLPPPLLQPPLPLPPPLPPWPPLRASTRRARQGVTAAA